MTTTPNDCVHLTVDIVRRIHAEAITRFGGSAELRDIALLESAVAAPPPRNQAWEDLTLTVASSEISRDGTTARLRQLVS